MNPRSHFRKLDGVDVTLIDGGKEFHFTMTKDYDNLALIQKVEVFEYALEKTKGELRMDRGDRSGFEELAVKGGAAVEGVTWGEGASQEHFALCRCGHSKNKPFCSGAHWDHQFDEHAPARK